MRVARFPLFLAAVHLPLIVAAAEPRPAVVTARAAVIETATEPARHARTPRGTLFVDFGTAAFGWLTIEFPSPAAADLPLTVWLGEKPAGDDAVDRQPGGSIRAQQVAAECAAGSTRVEIVPRWQPKYPHWIDTPPGLRQVAPFRYVEIEGLEAEAAVPRVIRMTRHVPFDDTAADFRCSDPALEEVWTLCKHSIKATSFLGIYTDGDRERIPYEADAYINQLCHYGVDAHYETGRLTHEHCLAYPTWPMEWRQHTPLMAWADWLYSGDDASLRRHYATIRDRLLLEYRRPDGLFRGQSAGTPRDIVDWPEGERDGYDMRPTVKTVTSAFHARGLEAMTAIAAAVGKPGDAAEFARLHQETRAAINAKLYDTARGVYIDGLDDQSDTPSHHASIHANMVPLAFGLVPAERIGSVAAFVAGRGMACSVYGAQYLLDGLYEAGRADDALALMTATHDRSWLHMSRDLGSTITLEAWDAKYKPNLDWNHAWGAVPANMIPRKLMGIEPIAPGFRRIRVRPQTGTLAWATIRHPSPRGPIDLAVRDSADEWVARLALPADVTAEVHLPTDDPARATITRDDQPLATGPLRTERGRCVYPAEAGVTTFRIERSAAGLSP